MTEDSSITGASPDAVAWRLTNVETEVKSLKEELKTSTDTIHTKLDNIASGFATHKDIENAIQQGRKEHDLIYLKIQEVESDVAVLKTRDGLKQTLLWVGLVASAIINIVVIYQLFSGEPR